MDFEIPEKWQPMPPQLGPPLPRSMQIYWPWVTRPPEEEAPEEPSPEVPSAKYRLYIYKVGNGTVTPTDGEYAAGTVVSLTAQPASGYVFSYWAGDAGGSNPSVSLTMDRSKSVTAYFSVGEAPPEEPPPEEPPPEEPQPEEPPPEEPLPEEPPPEEVPAYPFSFSNLRVQRLTCQTATAWNTLDFWCTITNPTDKTITHTLTPMYRVQYKGGYSDPLSEQKYAREITLGPGESYDYYMPGNQPDRCTVLVGFSAGVPYGGCVFLRDENGNESPQACI